uniref:non-specific serine/threonine protein kinase n=1 Tax=Knipowitschia caucasica TaxID=637954 RepID=A0AAV2KZX7_KNICA
MRVIFIQNAGFVAAFSPSSPTYSSVMCLLAAVVVDLARAHPRLEGLSRVDRSPPPPPPPALPAPPAPPSSSSPADSPPRDRRGSGVKKHHHKHNLKHRYELLETLGRGTYGKVKKAIERSSGRVVAIKSIRKDKIKDEQDKVHIRREIEIMSSLRHPHIISIYEVDLAPAADHYSSATIAGRKDKRV